MIFFLNQFRFCLLPLLLLLSLRSYSSCHGGECNASAVATYSLQDCIRIASQQNPEVLIAAKQIDVGKGNLLVARSGFIPLWSASGNYDKRQAQYIESLQHSKDRRSVDYTVSTRVTQNVYSAGRVRAQVDMAKKNLKTQGLNLKTTLNSVAFSTKQIFYQILQSETAVTIRAQAVEILEQELSNQEKFFKAGEVPEVNVLRAKVNLANEKPLYEDAVFNLHAHYIDLAQLLGIDLNPQIPDVPFKITGSLEDISTSFPSLEECLTRAEFQRPELAAKVLQIGIARRQITVDQATTLPRMDAFAGYELFSEPNKHSKNSWYSGPMCGVSVAWQIFDGLATVGRVRADRARVLMAADDLVQTRNTVQSEVRIAYEAAQQALRALNAQGNNVQMAKRALELITNNVNNGLASQLDLLQARYEFTRSQLTRLDSLFLYNVAVAKLIKAMGQIEPLFP